MNGYFIAIILIYAISVGMNLQSHGEPKTGFDNAWSTLITALIMTTLTALAIIKGF